MRDFSITLDGKEYKVTSSNSDSFGNNWIIRAIHGSIESVITIPSKERVTRAKILLFIEAYHVALNKAFEDQKLDQDYTMNQKHTIK